MSAKAWLESESGFGFPPLPPKVHRRYKSWVKERHSVLDRRRWGEAADESGEDDNEGSEDDISEMARALSKRRWDKEKGTQLLYFQEILTSPINKYC